MTRTKRAVKFYHSNSDYRFLYNCVADLFAKLLKSDIEYLKLGEIDKISMASKWCPLDNFQDQQTLLCEGIARLVFPLDSDPEYKDIEEAQYVYRVRNRLWKEVLVPLRKALGSGKECESVPWEPALSDAMKKLYEDIFDKKFQYCGMSFSKVYEEKYEAYLEIATQWKKASEQLLPNEIVVNLNNGIDRKVVECEWQRLVRHMEKEGRLKNCLAICDIPKTIGAIQKDLRASMGVLLSELSDEPWKGKVITCSPNPELRRIKGDNLQSKIEFVKRLECDDNIDMQKVYDQLLEFSVAKKSSPDRMLKAVYLFHYKEFSDEFSNEESFQLKVYRIPFFFLDLRDASISMTRKCEKVAMVPSLEDLVKSVPKPEELMESAISGEREQ
ncbi:hypothetical protein ACB092_07G110800 [Castanea dentata]